MANTPRPPLPRSRLLTAAGLVAAVGTLLTAVLLRRGRSAPPIQTAPAMVSPPVPVATLPQTEPPRPKPIPKSTFSPLRWLVFALMLAGISVGLVLLQNSDSPVSIVFFVLLVFGTAGYGIRAKPQELQDLLHEGLNSLRRWSQIILARRALLGIVSGVLAVICMIQAATGFLIAGASPSLAHMPLRWMLAGLILMGTAVALNPLPFPLLDSITRTNRSAKGIRWRVVLVGVIALAALAEINGNALRLFSQEITFHAQIGLFALGIVCLIWGFSGDWRWPRFSRFELLILLAITALALVLRTVILETSIHRFIDEMNFIHAINQLETEPYIRILTPFGNITSFTWVYPYLQTLSVNWFGHTLAAVRLVSSVFGALTVTALYFLARALFDRTTATIAALLLATFPAHLHFSRIGLNNIADPLVGTLALAFMARAWKYNRRSDYVLAGAMLGLTQYFYEGGRLLFPALAVGWVILIWFAQRGWRDDREKAILALVVMALIAAPLYYTTLTTQGALTPRLNNTAVSLSDWVNLFRNTAPDSFKRYQRFAIPFLTYVNLADMGWFYGGHEALILSAILPLFLLGAGLVIWHVRAPGALLLLLWVIGTSLGNTLLYENAWTPRYVVAFPALALILAIGIRYGAALFWRGRRYIILIIALTIGVAGWQTNYYFNVHLPTFAEQFRSVKDLEDIYFRLQDIPPDTQVHIVYNASIWEFNLDTLIHFWRLPITAEARFPQELTPDYMTALSPSVSHAFFVEPDNTDSLNIIRKYFYLLPPRFSPFDVPQDKQLGLYYAPRYTHSP